MSFQSSGRVNRRNYNLLLGNTGAVAVPGAFNSARNGISNNPPTDIAILSNSDRTLFIDWPANVVGYGGNTPSLQGHADQRYIEFTFTQAGVLGQVLFGLVLPGTTIGPVEGGTFQNARPGTPINTIGLNTDGQVFTNGANVGNFGAYAAGDVVMMLWDGATGEFRAGRNGVLFNGGAAITTIAAGTMHACAALDIVSLFAGSASWTGNFTGATQVYPTPGGYTPWDD